MTFGCGGCTAYAAATSGHHRPDPSDFPPFPQEHSTMKLPTANEPPLPRARSCCAASPSPPAAATRRPTADDGRICDRHHGRADHEHRRQHRRRPCRRDRHRAGGHQLAHVRTASRASPRCCPTADVVYLNGLVLEEPTKAARRGEPGRRRRRSSSWARSPSPRATTSTTSRSRRRMASRTRTCGPIRRSRCATPRSCKDDMSERDPGNADVLRRELRRVRGA